MHNLAKYEYHHHLNIPIPMLRRLLRRDVEWQRRRLFSITSTARELPDNINDNLNNEGVGRRNPGKRLPKEQRKALVVDFVEKYRAMNGGKFPSNAVTKKEVGGSYYIIRAILQELEYNSKMHDVASAERISTVRQSAQGSELSGVREVENEILTSQTADITEGHKLFEKDAKAVSELDLLAREMNAANTKNIVDHSQLPSVETCSSMVRQTTEANEVQQGGEIPNQVALGTTPVEEYVEVTAETSSSIEGEVDTSSCHRRLDMSMQTEINEIPTERGSQSETGVHLDHERTSFGDVDNCGKKILMSREVLENSSVEKTPADESIKAKVKIGSGREGEVDTNSRHGQLDMSVKAKINEIATEEVFVNGTGVHLEHERASLADEGNCDKNIVTSREVMAHSSLGKVPTDETEKGTEMEDAKFSATPGDPSQSAAQASNKISRETTTEKTQDEQQESSLWGNLKLFASNIMNMWRNN